MAKGNNSVWRIFGTITVSAVVIIFYGIAITLLGMTIIRPVWIIAVSIAFAVLTALVFWRKWRFITESCNTIINVICHLIATTGLFMALILGVNYFKRDTSETETVHAEIIKIYSETRHRTKRVARNRYTRGEPYKVYFMDVRLPDGQKHKRSISLKSYNQYAYSSHRHRERPDSVNLLLTKGALGMTIIERDPYK